MGAKFALKTLKAKTAFIMSDQANDYAKGLAEYFVTAFTAGGGKIVGKENYTAKDTDFSAILAKVSAAKPDLIYLPDYYNVVNLAAKQARERHQGPLHGRRRLGFLRAGPEGSRRWIFTNHYSPKDTSP